MAPSLALISKTVKELVAHERRQVAREALTTDDLVDYASNMSKEDRAKLLFKLKLQDPVMMAHVTKLSCDTGDILKLLSSAEYQTLDNISVDMVVSIIECMPLDRKRELAATLSFSVDSLTDPIHLSNIVSRLSRDDLSTFFKDVLYKIPIYDKGTEIAKMVQNHARKAKNVCVYGVKNLKSTEKKEHDAKVYAEKRNVKYPQQIGARRTTEPGRTEQAARAAHPDNRMATQAASTGSRQTTHVLPIDNRLTDQAQSVAGRRTVPHSLPSTLTKSAIHNPTVAPIAWQAVPEGPAGSAVEDIRLDTEPGIGYLPDDDSYIEEDMFQTPHHVPLSVGSGSTRRPVHFEPVSAPAPEPKSVSKETAIQDINPYDLVDGVDEDDPIDRTVSSLYPMFMQYKRIVDAHATSDRGGIAFDCEFMKRINDSKRLFLAFVSAIDIRTGKILINNLRVRVAKTPAIMAIVVLWSARNQK